MVDEVGTFQCAMCGEIHELSDEGEALAEFKENFGDNIPLSECVNVCDDCYEKIHPKRHPEKVEEVKRYYGYGVTDGD